MLARAKLGLKRRACQCKCPRPQRQTQPAGMPLLSARCPRTAQRRCTGAPVLAGPSQVGTCTRAGAADFTQRANACAIGDHRLRCLHQECDDGEQPLRNKPRSTLCRHGPWDADAGLLARPVHVGVRWRRGQLLASGRPGYIQPSDACRQEPQGRASRFWCKDRSDAMAAACTRTLARLLC